MHLEEVKVLGIKEEERLSVAETPIEVDEVEAVVAVEAVR